MPINPLQTGIAVALALGVIGIFFVFPSLSPFTSSIATQPAATDTTTITNDQSAPATTTTTMPITDNGQLQITDEVVGTGATAAAGDTVTVKYVGSFTNGTVFDASASHQETANGFSVVLGAGHVIKGWDEGLIGMREGGTRRLVVPPALGYGPNDYGPIPGNSTLVFEVELVKVQKAQ